MTDRILHAEKWKEQTCDSISDLEGLLRQQGPRFAALLAEHDIQQQTSPLA